MPLQVTVWAPLITNYSEDLKRVIGVDAHEVSTTGSAAEIIDV